MIRLCSFLCLGILVIAAPCRAADDMKFQFVFPAPKPCTTVFGNPEIKLQNVPAGTRSVLVRFRREKNYEMGGQEVPFPSNGVLKPDTLRTWGPCNVGLYTYEVIAKSGTGAVLAKAEWSEPYPP